jgi:capsular exopolysaccharide synthesis family protein
MTYAVTAHSDSHSPGASLTATKEVAAVLSEMLTTDMIYEGIRTADSRLKDFNGTITAQQVGETNFIIVNVVAFTPEQAFLALTTLTEVFPNVVDYISNRCSLAIMKAPAVSSAPVNAGNARRTAILAGVVGAMAMAVLICYMNIQRGTVQTRTGARQTLDAPIIASLEHERKNRTLKSLIHRVNKHVQVFSPTISFAYSEQISVINNQLEHEADEKGRKMFMVTGIGESEGKSTVAGNIAAGLALRGHKVALLDCDLRKPAQNKFFDDTYSSAMPLNKMLAQPFSYENMENCCVANQRLGLHMYFALRQDSRSVELLSGETMKHLLQALGNYDFVIIDTPPMGMFPDAEVIADMVDATLLVVRQDYVPAMDINGTIDTLQKCKASFLGVVLNDMVELGYGVPGYGSYYGYGRKYGYGESVLHHHADSAKIDGEGGHRHE